MDLKGQAALSTTDERGFYRIEGVDPGLHRAWALPPDALNRLGAYYDDRYLFCNAEILRLESDQTLSGIDFLLPVGGSLWGTVVDSNGAPLAGQRVTATGVGYFHQGLIRESWTDDEGQYRITGLDSFVEDEEILPGLYELRVSLAPLGEVPMAGAGWFPGAWNPEGAEFIHAVRGEDRRADLVVPAGATVAGRVLEEDRPVPGAEVFLSMRNASVPPSTTDSTGRFYFDAVPGSEFQLRVEAEGFSRTWSPGVDTQAEADWLLLEAGEVTTVPDLVLAEAAVLEVRVSGLEEQAGYGAQLVVRQASDGGGGERLLARSVGPETSSTPARLEHLPAGAVSVEVQLAGTSPLLPFRTAEPIRLVAGETRQLDISMLEGGQLVGSVRTRTGTAVRGAAITVFDASDEMEVAGGRTDGDGAFVVQGLDTGAYLVQVEWLPFCTGDPSRVTTYWPEARSLRSADVVSVGTEERVELGLIYLPPDGDADGMDDVWELAWGLNPQRADGALDADGDGVSNLEEYLGYSDPLRLDETPSLDCGASLLSLGGSARGHGPVALLMAWALLGLVSRGRNPGRMRRSCVGPAKHR